MTDAPDYMSASQIKTFMNCPESYRFRYEENAEVTKAASGFGARGSAFHEAIENVLNENMALRDRDRLAYLFKQEYRSLDYDIPEHLYNETLDFFDVAARYIEKRDEAFRDIEAQGKFEVNRPDISTKFLGYIDVTTENEIWDWKTGTIRGDETFKEERIQGSVYMAAYMNLYGEEPESIKFIYVKEEKVRTIEPVDENWQFMLGHARRLMHAQEKAEYEAKPSGFCYWCGYEMQCEYSDVGVGEEDWRKY